MNLDAVVLVGRANIEKPGLSPFSPMASGICIDPDGVVATCCHAMVNFFESRSPYFIPKGPDVKEVIPEAERQERPFFLFPTKTIWEQPVGEHEVSVYPMLSFQGNPSRDVAVVELGGGGIDRPLPFVGIARVSPGIGDTVRFAVCQEEGATLDEECQLLGWSMPQVQTTVVASVVDGFLIDYPVKSGMSGGGVLNTSGELVGVIVQHWPSAFSLSQIGIDRPLGLCMSALLLIPELLKLQSEAILRSKSGGLRWCGLPE